MSQLPCAAVTRHTGLTRCTACVTPTVARRSPSSITPATAAEDAASPEKTDTSPTLPSSEAPPPTTATPGSRCWRPRNSGSGSRWYVSPKRTRRRSRPSPSPTMVRIWSATSSGGPRAQERNQAPHAVAEVLQRDALVDAVDGLLVVLAQHEGDEAVARDPVLPEVMTVREARDHARNDRRTPQVRGGELADRGHQAGARIGGRGGEREQRVDPNGFVGDHLAQERQEVRGPLAGEQAAVELRARLLGDDVDLGAPLEDGGSHGVPDEGVLTRITGELGEEGRILERLAQVAELAAQWLAFEGRQGGEILL